MQGTIFQSAQRIIAQVLEWLQSSTNSSIAERVSDTFQNGVCANDLNSMAIVGKDLDSTLLDFFHVEVQTGLAYISGERVPLLDSPLITYNAANPLETTFDGVSENVPTPQSTGSYNIPLTAGFTNYLFIGYLATIDTTAFTLNDVTLAKQFYKQTDGYQIVVNTTGINPDVTTYIFIGQVNLSGTNQAVSSNISIVARPAYKTLLNRVGIQTNNSGETDRPATYAIGSNDYFLDDHIKSVGTGTVSPFNAHGLSLTDLGVNVNDTVEFHREHEHVRGIIAGTPTNPDPIGSAMFAQRVQVTPGDDFVIIQALGPNEVAVLNGVAYTSAQFGVNVTIPFTGNPAGVYNIYFDGTTFGITTASIVDDVTKLWLATTTWTPTPGDGNLSIPADRRQFGTLDLLQRWVTAGRPQDPQAGNFGYNFDSNQLEFYNGTVWLQPTNVASPFNGLTNGGTNIWQRGTSFPAVPPGTFTADCYEISYDGTPTINVTQETSVLPSNAQFAVKTAYTPGGSPTEMVHRNNVENYWDYAGKTVTVSAVVNSNVPNTIGIAIVSNLVASPATYHPGDGQYHTISATLVLPTGITSLAAFIGIIGGAVPTTVTFYFTNSMFVEGNQVVPFIPISPEEDVAQCQRYFEQNLGFAYRSYNGFVGATTLGFPWQFSTQKRVPPIMTVTVGTVVGLATGATGSFSTVNGFGYQINVSATGAFGVGDANNATWKAEAD